MCGYSRKTARFTQLLACVLFAMPGLPRADEPALDAKLLGVTESALNYCSKVDAASAAKLQEEVRQLVQGASEESVANVRKTEVYLLAYDSATAYFSGVAEQDAKRACSESLDESQ